MANGDYYSTLGLEPEAAPKQIKEAFRRLALQHHPDRNRDDSQAAARMKAINEAYAVLSNPRKRAEYDHLRRSFGSAAYGRFREAHSEQDIFRGSDVNQIFEEISRAFGFRGFEDVFRDHYGPGFRSFEFSKPGVFGRAFVFTTGPRRAAAAGPGKDGGSKLGRMLAQGLKRLWGLEPPERGADRRDSITLAPQLARSGGKIRYLYRKEGRELIVNIPPNMRGGQQIRLRGLGARGKGGGPPGDLYVRVRIRRSWQEWIRKLIQRLKAHGSRRKGRG